MPARQVTTTNQLEMLELFAMILMNAHWTLTTALSMLTVPILTVPLSVPAKPDTKARGLQILSYFRAKTKI